MKKTLVKTVNPEEAKGESKFKVKGVDKKQLSLLEKGKLPLSVLGGLIAGAGVSYAFSFIDGETIEDPKEEKPDDSYTYEFEAPTTISFSDNVNDSMSFGEAFSTARADTGSGGFFNWRGNTYHTLTKEEWDSLSDEEKEAYLEDISEHIDFKDGEYNKVDPDNDGDTTPDDGDDITPDDDTTPDDEFSNIDEVIDEEDLIEDLNEEDFIEETDGIDGGIDQESEDNEIEYDDDFADDLLKKTDSSLDETDLDL